MLEPAGELQGGLIEVDKCQMGYCRCPAPVEQGAFGQHQVGAVGHAEVRAAVAHDDAQLPRLPFQEAALAGAGQGSGQDC